MWSFLKEQLLLNQILLRPTSVPRTGLGGGLWSGGGCIFDHKLILKWEGSVSAACLKPVGASCSAFLWLEEAESERADSHGFPPRYLSGMPMGGADVHSGEQMKTDPWCGGGGRGPVFTGFSRTPFVFLFCCQTQIDFSNLRSVSEGGRGQQVMGEGRVGAGVSSGRQHSSVSA